MAKVEITHSCGHRQFDDVYTYGRFRREREIWLSHTPCRICQGELYREEDLADGYPTLLGSKAQNAWAYQIRHDAIKELRRYIAVFSSSENDAHVARKIELNRAALELAKGKGTASWWIDHRDSPYKDLINEADTSQQKGE